MNYWQEDNNEYPGGTQPIPQSDEPWKPVEYTEPRQEAPETPSVPFEALDSFRETESAPEKRVKGQEKGRKFWRAAAWTMAAAFLVGVACFAAGTAVNIRWQRRVDSMEQAYAEQIADMEQKIDDLSRGNPSVSGVVSAPVEGMTPAQVYAMNVQSVVMIRSAVQSSYSTGSGFILSADGYVVTNHHVIEGGGKLTVITTDGKEHPARLVGSDNTNDVALLKIEVTGLQPVVIGSSSELVVGDQVVAIGNPLGELTSTLTVGYVSAKERDVNTDGFAINMLQTDAAINSGNSGGPLFNMRGEVVGITTAKYSGTSSSGATIEGVGFAIPIDDVLDLLEDLASFGYVTGAYMGVRVSDMDPEAASYYGLPVGAYVQGTDEGGPAQLAGIRSKDIIVKVGDYDIGTVNDLTRALRNFEAGDTVTVVVYRGGGEVRLSITLAEKPAQ